MAGGAATGSNFEVPAFKFLSAGTCDADLLLRAGERAGVRGADDLFSILWPRAFFSRGRDPIKPHWEQRRVGIGKDKNAVGIRARCADVGPLYYGIQICRSLNRVCEIRNQMDQGGVDRDADCRLRRSGNRAVVVRRYAVALGRSVHERMRGARPICAGHCGC